LAREAPSSTAAAVQPAAGETLAALERMLSSPPFENSERLCRFLRFVIKKTLDGEGGEIKEYLIALEVYGRAPSYDPKVDSIVRVEASRLRTKLREYYETQGREDEVRIELPKGSYVPVLRLLPGAAVAEPVAAPSPAPSSPVPAGIAPSGRRFWRGWALAGFMLATAALGGLLFYSRRGVPPPDGAVADPVAADLTSVAVLPFLSLGQEAGQQAFADGLTEDVTEALARVKELRVAGRASASRFKGKADAIPALGRQLKVGAIVDGSVRQDGGHVRITAQLVSTVDGFHLWSETFDRQAKDKLALQSEVSGAIGRAVTAALASASSSFAKQLLTQPEQVDLFRKGIELLDWRYDHIMLRGEAAEQPQPLAELMRAIGHFEQVVARDPRHARAYAALAHTYLRAAEYDPRLSAKSRAAAGRALELDAGIGAAHAILGYGQFLQDWDFPNAEKSFRRSLELDPRLLGIYRLYADCASLLGHQAEALAMIDRGRAALPDEPLLRIAKGVALYHARRYAPMAEEARQLLAAQPNLAPAHWLLGLAIEQLGQLDAAAAEFEATLKIAEKDPRATTALGHIYGKLGRRQEALRIIGELGQRPQRARPAYSIAMIHAGLGDREAAFEWLQRSFDRHETSTPYMTLDPRFDGLRSDARFKALLAGLKL
jgi:TolB-like protein/Tfp pilus assembly protein PilF